MMRIIRNTLLWENPAGSGEPQAAEPAEKESIPVIQVVNHQIMVTVTQIQL